MVVKMKQTKLINISVIKTVMLLLVVFYHCCCFYGGNWISFIKPIKCIKNIGYLTEFLNIFMVQTFTMASGFLYFYKKNANITMKTKDGIKRRFNRLIIPYIIVSILWVIPFDIIFNNSTIMQIFKNYFLGFSPSQLWFILMIFNEYLIFEIIHKKLKFNLKEFIIIYILALFVGSIFSLLNFNYFQLSTSIKYIIYFYFGGFLYKHEKLQKNKNLFLIFSFSSILFIITELLSSKTNRLLHYIVLSIRPLISIMYTYIVYNIVTKFLNKNGRIYQNNIFTFLESVSFGIYLFHQQIIYLLIYVLNGLFPPLIDILIKFILTMLITSVIIVCLKRNSILKKMLKL